MSDTPEQHDEATLPADAVEDLTPEDDHDVSGGALNAFQKVTPSSPALKIESPGAINMCDGSV
jgi:hypothetical protein